MDVTSTVVAAPTDRHVVAVRQPWTCTGSFMLMWNRGETRQAGKRSGSGFIHAEAHFPNICTACFSLFFFFILGGKPVLTSPINDPTSTQPGQTGSYIIIILYYSICSSCLLLLECETFPVLIQGSSSKVTIMVLGN